MSSFVQDDRIRALVHELTEREAALDEWFGDQVDAVIDPASGRPVFLRHAWDELYRHEERVQEQTTALHAANRELWVQREELLAHQEELRVQKEELRQQNEALAAAQQELKVERQRYQELFDLAPDGYLVTNLWGTIRQANQAAAKLLGVPQNALEGKPLAVYVTYANRLAFRERLLRLQQDQVREVRDWSVQLQPRNRTPIDASITITSIQDRSGRVTGLRWLVRDTTERVQIACEREARLARLDALLEISQQVLAETTMEGVLQRVVDVARELTGARVGIAGHGFYSGIFYIDSISNIPEGAPYLPSDMFRIERGGVYMELLEGRNTLRLTDEEMRAHPAWWGLPDGHVPLRGLLGARFTRQDQRANGLIMLSDKREGEFTAEDETLLAQLAALTSLAIQHIEARNEAEQRANELDTVFEAITDGITIHNAEGELVRANPAVVEFSGKDLVGEDWDQVCQIFQIRDSEGRQVPVEEMPPNRALRGKRVRGQDLHLINDRGEELAVRVSAAPLLPNGQVAGAVSVWHDVTALEEAQQARERLLEENRSQRKLLEQLMAAEPVGIAVVGIEDHCYQYANLSYETAPGMPSVHLVGHTPEEVLPGPAAEEASRLLNEIRQNSEMIRVRERRFPAAPGQGDTYWNVDHVPLRGESGQVDRVLIVANDVTPQVQARKWIEELLARNEAVLSSMNEGLALFDLQGNIVEANPVALRLHGLDQTEWREHNLDEFALLFELRDPRGRLLPREEWPPTRALRGERFADMEVQVRRKDTGHTWLASYNGTPVHDQDGNRILGLITTRDVTARREAERQVRQYADRLRILRKTDEAILSSRSAEEVAWAALSQVSRLLPCQRANVVMFDFQAREVSLLAVYAAGETELGNGWRGPMDEMWGPVIDKLAQAQEYIIEDIQALSSPSPLTAQLQTEGVRAQVYEPILAHQTLVGALGLGMSVPGPLPLEQMEVVRELTSVLAIGIEQARLYEQVRHYAGKLEQRVRQRTEELSERTAALEVSEARFRAMFEEAAIGIALVNQESHLTTTNPALQHLLGYSEQEMKDMPLFELLAPDDSSGGNRLFQELVAGERTEYTLEQRYVRKDGKPVDASVTMSLISPVQETPAFAIAMVEDITERKQAQEALIQSEKLSATGRLAASLAHEINNPLQSVIGFLGLTNEMLEEREDASQFVQVAMEELERAARIVHQLRNLHRRSEAQKELTDMNELVERVLLLSRKQCQDHHVEVVWEAAENLPAVPMVPDRIQQVFLNMALNAVDAIPDGGQLRVRTARTDGPSGVLVVFADTGVGIPAEQLEHLFEAFHSTKEQGLGLGLYVSHNIVREHGGWIDVQSQVGKGTTFTVWLPVEGEQLLAL